MEDWKIILLEHYRYMEFVVLFFVFIQARKFGVRSAMPGFIARKLCPELILVPTDFKKYIHYSELTRKGFLFCVIAFYTVSFPLITYGSLKCNFLLVFLRYDPNFIAGSLDEAYLDITEVCRERNVKCEEVSWSY